MQTNVHSGSRISCEHCEHCRRKHTADTGNMQTKMVTRETIFEGRADSAEGQVVLLVALAAFIADDSLGLDTLFRGKDVLDRL